MTTRLHTSMQQFARLTLLLLSAAAASVASAQLPFFSGAEGFGTTHMGTEPTGGWFADARIYHVTTTQDLLDGDGKPVDGTLRRAFLDEELKEAGGNVIVVFDVGGTFQLTQGKLNIKNITNYYIAGQTAPSPVTVYGDMSQVTHSSGKQTSNIILRYMSFRKGTSGDDDSITFAGSGLGTNVIFDHLSASWSEDEIISVTNNNTNVTVQYSTIHDALVSSHAYGSLLRPQIDSNVSFHHNLYAHNASRQARFGTYNAETLTADFRNNVVYNWRDRASYAGGSTDAEQEYANVNYVGNYLIAGPKTTSNIGTAFVVDKNVDASIYQSGNYIDSDKTANPGGVPNGSDTGWGMFAYNPPITDQHLYQMTTPFATPAVTTQTALDAYNQIVDYVGNWWWDRDAIDSRLINDVVTFASPATIGPASPNATELAYVTGATPTSHPTGWDTDDDGMPDYWEAAHGLNPTSGVDSVTYNAGNPSQHDFDLDGYTNLEEYLNDVGAFPAPAPIVFNGATNSRYAQITNWKTDDGGITTGSNWQPSRFDEAQINSGTAVVDAVGQHAGVLKIGSHPGNVAALSITGGWLDVDEELVIGADDAATASLSLSGGILNVPTLSKGDGGSFSFTGGVLHADTVGFSFANQGGTLSPGQSIGQTVVDGDLTLTSGTLEIELASALLADMLAVDGLVTLGGDLDVVLLDGFAPTSGSWEVITSAGGFEGSFAVVTEGYSVYRQGDSLFLQVGTELAGDYNGDGAVDAADYTVWRDGLGTIYTEADYNVWKEHFGETSLGSGSSSQRVASGDLAGSATVPEPATSVLMLCGGLLAVAMATRPREKRGQYCLFAHAGSLVASEKRPAGCRHG
jgi:hypothetical protein